MNINLKCPVNPLGYGVVGRNVFRTLSKDHEITFWPIGQPHIESKEEGEELSKAVARQESYYRMAPSVLIWHQHSLAEHIGKGQHCGFPIFELDKFTNREKHHLLSQDKIFVTSMWAKSVILNNIDIEDDRVFVVPLGVDLDIFSPLPQLFPPLNKELNKPGPTVFLNVGKWEYRKGHDILIDAFNMAFEPSDNVMLQMMNHNPFLNEQQAEEWHGKYKNCKMGDHVLLIPRVNSHSEVAKIMTMADCGVFPSRAEGWNLEALEMMALGKRVIVTNYSAHTEFCNEDNACLIDIDNTEEAWDGLWFHGQGNWAELGEKQLDQLVNYMRLIHKIKQSEDNIPGNDAAVQTAKKFTWENTANAIINAIQTL